jgi:hypothetical protein
MISSFSDAGSVSPIPDHAFFEQPQFERLRTPTLVTHGAALAQHPRHGVPR